MLIFAAIITLACAASAEQTYVLNRTAVSEMIKRFNGVIHSNGLDIKTVFNPTRKYDMGLGVAIGLNTLELRGDCFATEYDDGSFKADLNIGERLLFLAFHNLTIISTNETMAAVLQVKQNAVHVSFKVNTPMRNCSVVLDDLEMQVFDDLILFSSIPKYDDTVANELFSDFGRGYINTELYFLRNDIEKAINNFICGPKKISLFNSIV